jgi:hypothetical protein
MTVISSTSAPASAELSNAFLSRKAAQQPAVLPSTEPSPLPNTTMPNIPLPTPRLPNRPFTAPPKPERHTNPTPNSPVPARPDPAPEIEPSRRQRGC